MEFSGVVGSVESLDLESDMERVPSRTMLVIILSKLNLKELTVPTNPMRRPCLKCH